MSRLLTALATVAIFTLTTAAGPFGGFQLGAEIPSGSTKVGDAVLVVKTYGCSKPENAKLSAVARGIVDAEKVSKRIKLVRVSKGVYTIAQQWPDEGSWVITITGKYRGHTSSLLVGMDEGAVFEGHGRWTGKLDNGYPVRLLDRDVTTTDVHRAFAEMGD